MNRLISVACSIGFIMQVAPAFAAQAVLSFDTAPVIELPMMGGDPRPPLLSGDWSSQEDGANNILDGAPMWNAGGFIQPHGTETPLVNRGAVGFGGPALGINSASIKTNQFTGVIVYDDTSWGDMRTATHVTMDVKGSFAGSGGISVIIESLDVEAVPLPSSSPIMWSWGAAATDIAVGANPGNVTEWTTITIPINTPGIDSSDPPMVDGVNRWQVQGGAAVDWEDSLIRVNRLQVMGITPDTQIDNLGFILPDTGTSGDYNDNGIVDAADYTDWLDNLGAPAGTLPNDGDGGAIGQAQYDTWKANFGTGGSASATNSAIPEPCSALLAVCGLITLLGFRRV